MSIQTCKVCGVTGDDNWNSWCACGEREAEIESLRAQLSESAERAAAREETNRQVTTALMQVTAENISLREALGDIQQHTRPPFVGEKWTNYCHDVAAATLAAAAQQDRCRFCGKTFPAVTTFAAHARDCAKELHDALGERARQVTPDE